MYYGSLEHVQLCLLCGIWLQIKAVHGYFVPPVAQHPFGVANHPFPGRDGTSLAPMFPFTHHFANGLQYGSGGGYYQRGDLNIPLLRWGAIWNLKSLIRTGTNAPWYNYGHAVQPINTLKLSPERVMKMMLDPQFNAARQLTYGSKPPISVANLPGDWNLAHCYPPLCNPFVHSMGIGLLAQKSKNFEFDGLLDFPVPTGPYGEGVRFPLTGNFYNGPFPASVFYSHHLNPVDPFPRLGKRSQ